jgi:hypothetical protein
MNLRIDVYVHTSDDLATRLDEILKAIQESTADKATLVKATKDLKDHTELLRKAAENAVVTNQT